MDHNMLEPAAMPTNTTVMPETNGKKSRKILWIAPIVVVLVAGLGVSVWYSGVFSFKNHFRLEAAKSDKQGIDPATDFVLKTDKPLSKAVLEKTLTFEPAVDYEVKQRSFLATSFDIHPKKPLDSESVYVVKIAGMQSADHDYSWAYQVKSAVSVYTQIPSNDSDNVPINTGIEIGFSRDGIQNADALFSIEPKVEGSLSVIKDTIRFVPKKELERSTIYKVTIKKGLAFSGTTDTLDEDVVIKFETEGQPYNEKTPSISFNTQFSEFKADVVPLFSVFANNLKSINTTVYRFKDQNDFIKKYDDSIDKEYYWSIYHNTHPLSLEKEEKVITADLPVEAQESFQHLRLPKTLGEGYYLVEVNLDGDKRYAWFQVTPLINFLSVSGTKTVIWVKNGGDRSNAVGATVSYQGKQLAVTGNDGVAIFETPDDVKKSTAGYDGDFSQSNFYTVTSGGSSAAMPIVSQEGYYGGQTNKPDHWWTYLSTDKPLYLPNDTLSFWGILKNRQGKDITGQKLEISLGDYGSGSEPYAKTESLITDYNTYTGTFNFSAMTPGLYYLNVKLGDEVVMTKNIDIEAYVKPAYSLDVSVDKEELFAGESVTFKIKGTFFDGTPVSNLKLKYEFGDTRASDEKTEVTLDQNGMASLTLPTYKYDPIESWPQYEPFDVVPAVSEEGEVSGGYNVLVYGSKTELRVDQSIEKTKNIFNVKTVTVVPQATFQGIMAMQDFPVQPNIKVVAEVDEVINIQTETGRIYDPITKTTLPQYSYSTEEKKVSTVELTTGLDGRAVFEWTPEKGKEYKVYFRVTDKDGRLDEWYAWVYGGSYSYFGSTDAEGVYLENIDIGKTDYNIGEAVKLQIKSNGGTPVPDSKNNFLMIRMVNGIRSYKEMDESFLNEPFSEEYIPNVQYVGVWFSGKRFYNTSPENVALNDAERTLSIKVTPDKTSYRPHDKVNLKIEVKDKSGKARQTEINIAAIDQAIYALNPEEQNPVGDIYRNLFTSIITRSSHVFQEGSGAEGGGCFVGGTKVMTPDGEKAIEDIKVGDKVITRAATNSNILVPASVYAISSHVIPGYLSINNNLKLTNNHKLWVNGAWKRAGTVKVGDVIEDEQGKQIEVTSIKSFDGWLRVYNIEIETYHTFLADGIYVHNAEKAGGSRIDFQNLILYKTIRTDASGHVEVSMDLPDNLTSWRVTTQGVTQDLHVGKDVTLVPSTLPFFVETSLNNSYLAGDAITLRARTFGTANIRDNITYTVKSDTLPFKTMTKKGGAEMTFDLGALPVGDHKVEIIAEAPGGNKDGIVRSVHVVESYFSTMTASYTDVSAGLKDPRGSTSGRTSLVFCGCDRSRWYPLLESMKYDYYARTDSAISSLIAKELLHSYFNEEGENQGIQVGAYQADGGFSLLSYSSPDLILSAKISDLLHGDKEATFDRSGLNSYFRGILNDKNTDIHRAILAYYGLAALGEPVLIDLQELKDDVNLTTFDKINIARGLELLGSKEEVREYFDKAIKPMLAEQKPYMYVTGFEDKDSTIIATSQVAAIAAGINRPEAEKLGQYAIDQQTTGTLHSVELMTYLKEVLPMSSDEAGEITYKTTGGEVTKKLEKNEPYRLELLPEELKSFNVTGVKGKVRLVVVADRIIDQTTLKKDGNMTITRSYSVDGKPVTEFKDGDLVKVELQAMYDPKALDGDYQITDYLPSGMRAITSPTVQPGAGDSDSNTVTPTPSVGMQKPVVLPATLRYPLQIDNQKVIFYSWKGDNRPFYYYARIVSKGTYKTEGPLIQSMKSLESENTGSSASVTIK